MRPPETIGRIAIVVAVIALALLFANWRINARSTELTEWAQSRGERVVKVESRYWDIGPYWHVKGAFYYYLETDKGVYWVKYVWGRTIERELSNGKYEEVE